VFNHRSTRKIYVVEAVWTCQSTSIDGRSTMCGHTFSYKGVGRTSYRRRWGMTTVDLIHHSLNFKISQIFDVTVLIKVCLHIVDGRRLTIDRCESMSIDYVWTQLYNSSASVFESSSCAWNNFPMWEIQFVQIFMDWGPDHHIGNERFSFATADIITMLYHKWLK
jgi:hypothetical protein